MSSISSIQQLMCRDDYNVTIKPNFRLYLIPGTTLACISILLNVAIVLTFRYMRTHSLLPSPSRSAVHFTILAFTDIFVAVAFVVSQVHAMRFQSYDDRIIQIAREPICRENRTHHLNLLFTVFETSRRSGRLIKGYSILRYILELTNRFANVYLAVDRTAMVCFPLSYGLSKQRTSDSSSGRQFLSFAIVPALFTSLGVVITLGVTRVLERIYEFYVFVILTLEVPLIPLLLCAVFLIVKRCRDHGESPRLVKESLRNLSQMTLALVILFIVCDIPNLIFQFGLWAGNRTISDSTSEWYFFFNNLQHVARMISSFFNFFVYFAMSRYFRSNFSAMLTTYFCCAPPEMISLTKAGNGGNEVGVRETEKSSIELG